MKKLSVIIASTLLVFGMSKAVVAQDNSDTNEASHDVSIDIPTVALLDIEGDGGEASSINLAPDFENLEAGEAVDFSQVENNELWLNYTSIVASDKKQDERTISVEVSDGLPGGISLLLEASVVSGNGGGNLGSPVSDGPVTLSTTAQDLVNEIGSGYTGDGNASGHQLTYSLGLEDDDFGQLIADQYSVTVTYTISGD